MPVSCTSHFHNMAQAGQACAIHANIASASRTQSAVDARVTQGGALMLQSQVVLVHPGRLRGHSHSTPQAAPPPDLPPVQDCIAPPSMRPHVPLRHQYDARLHPSIEWGANLVPNFVASLLGKLPEEAAFPSQPAMAGYIRHADPQDRISLPDLAFFADCLPPPVLALREVLGNWVPTMSLSVYFRGQPTSARAPSNPLDPALASNAPTEWLRFRFTSTFVANGVCDVQGQLWDDGDNLVAQSHQLARIIPPPRRQGQSSGTAAAKQT